MSFIVKALRRIFSLLFSIDKFSIVLISLFVETISHFYFILQSKSENVGTYSSSLIPLHSLVLMSVLGSNAIEVMKKKMQEISHLNEEKNRNSEIRGMPPSYITVKTSYDILPMNLETDEIGNIYKNISRNFCKTDHIYKSVIKNKRFLGAIIFNGNSIEKFGSEVVEFLCQENFQKHSVMNRNSLTCSKLKISKHHQYQMVKRNETSEESFTEMLAMNYEGIWYVDFAGKLQLLLTSSFMTIVLITCYNDFFLILVNQLKEGTQRRQNVCQYNNVSTQS